MWCAVTTSMLPFRGGILCRIWRAIQRHRERDRLANDKRSENNAWWSRILLWGKHAHVHTLPWSLLFLWLYGAFFKKMLFLCCMYRTHWIHVESDLTRPKCFSAGTTVCTFVLDIYETCSPNVSSEHWFSSFFEMFTFRSATIFVFKQALQPWTF